MVYLSDAGLQVRGLRGRLKKAGSFRGIALAATFWSAQAVAAQGGSRPLVEVTRLNSAAISPEMGFSGVVAATFLGNGSVVVADAGRYSLHLFDSSGKYVRSSGRRGKGPGEFTDLLWVSRCTDGTLVAFDAGGNRLEVFDDSLRFLRSILLPPWLHFDSFLNCNTATNYTMLLDRPRSSPSGKGSVTKYPAAVAAIDWTKGKADTLVVLDGTEFFFGAITPVFTELPLGQRAVAAAGPGLVVAGVTTSEAVLLFRDGSRKADSVRLGARQRATTSRDWQAALQVHVAREPLERNRTLLYALLSEAIAPPTLPIYDALLVDLKGAGWARQYSSEGPSVWKSLEVGARAARTFALPRTVDVLAIGSGRLLGVLRDSDGIETLALYVFP